MLLEREIVHVVEESQINTWVQVPAKLSFLLGYPQIIKSIDK